MSNKYIFEIGGAIGLIGSLIFVGIEIRQNTSAVRSSAQQAISEQITELYYTIAPDERLSNLLSRMKSLFLFILVLLLDIIQAGTADKVQIYSVSMGKNIPALVVLPDHYAQSDLHFNTLLL